MATDTIELNDIPTGMTGLTAKLFAQGSDTVVATLNTITERTNSKSTYRTTTTAGATGWHRIIVFDSGGTAFGGWWVDLTNTGIVHYARNESPESARSEPGQGAPPVSATWLEKIDYLYKAWRNKKTQTATEQNIFADNTTTVDQKASVSSDGTTVTVGEMGSGP